MFALVATAALLASSAYAQSLNLSQGCQSALETVATGPDGTCINAAGLIAQFATVNANTSLVSPINSWLTGVCSQPACSNQTISNIIGNITTGCATDLSSLGYSSSEQSTIIAEVQQFYPTVRQIACLKNTTSNNLCVTDLLTDIQGSVGTLSENNLGSIFTTVFAGSTQLQTVLKNAACSDCVKAAYNIIEQNFGSLISSSDKANLTSTCGSSFTDGNTPSDISQTAASTSSSSNKSGALGSFPITAITLALSGLATAFAFFA